MGAMGGNGGQWVSNGEKVNGKLVKSVLFNLLNYNAINTIISINAKS